MVATAQYFWFQHENRANRRVAFAYVAAEQPDDEMIYAANPKVGNFYLPGKVSGVQHLSTELLDNLDSRTWFVEDRLMAATAPKVQNRIHENSELVASYDVQVGPRLFTMRVHLHDPSPQMGK